MPSAFGKPVTTANRFGAAATPSAWTLVTTLTASASTSLSYTSFASASYGRYALLFTGFKALYTGNLQVYFSTDNGATYPTAKTDYYSIRSTGAATVGGLSAQAANFGYLFTGLENGIAKTTMGGELLFSYGVGSTGRSILTGTLGGWSFNSRQQIDISSNSYDDGAEVNAIKFLLDSGTITTGVIKIYGIT